MKVENTSFLTGKKNTMELDVTQEQMSRYIRGEGLVQDIFPNLTNAEREFLISGVTPEEWDKYLVHPKNDK